MKAHGTCNKGFHRATLALMLSIIALMTAWPAHAENLGPGGGTRVIVGDQVVGAYQVWLTTAPEPAQVGTLTVDVRLTDPKTNQRETNATIDLQLTNSSDGTLINAQATHHDAGNAVDYAAHIPIDVPGSYNVAVHIAGPAGVSDVKFVAPVLAARSGGTLVLIGLPFLGFLAILGGAWYWRSRQAMHQPGLA